ncbi:hypothetical protein FOZ62_022887 [Perkinsus olseni]|uniref:Ectonucleotide pyrophosphatase phosphodiesterase n=1 Tax=Perkinsus olseni TaxID=32597 RepID=A0A7J6PDA1_PEROL|nr:hypothetical protein FOZ62_022887 [Perkinsus olseni]
MPAMLRPLSQLIAFCMMNSATAQPVGTWPNAKYKQAIIIGVEGFGGVYLRNATTSELPTLAEILSSDRSCVNLLARTEYPPSSVATWASTLTGMAPSETGIVSDDWNRNALNPISLTDRSVPPISGRNEFPPTLFTLAKRWDEHIRTAFYSSRPPLRELIDESVDYASFRQFVDIDDDEKTVNKFIELLESDKFPHLSFLQLSGVEHAGRSTFYGSNQYYKALTRIDGMIGEIQDAVLRRSDDFNTLIVIMSNHGGYGNGHEEWMRPTAQVPIVFANTRYPIELPGNKGWGGWLDIKEVVPSVLGAMGVPVSRYQRGRDHSYRF